MTACRTIRAIVVLAAGIWLLIDVGNPPTLDAQAASSRSLSFEVASVKPSAGGRSLLPSVRGRQLTATNVPLRPVIRMAYGEIVDGALQQLQDRQLIGGPSWVNDDRFDIVATLPEGPRAQGDLLLMIRSLLAERFTLRVHVEERELPIYALAVARNDGQLGPALRPIAGDCGVEASRVTTSGSGRPTCGLRAGPGKIVGRAPIQLFVSNVGLARFLDRPVVDSTGLRGNFEITLQWTPTPDQTPDRLRSNNLDELTRNAGVNSDAPSLFTALQEQLGLKLDPRNGPTQVIVIDSVERPTQN